MGRAGRLETALRAIQQENVDVEFIQENKLTQGIHTRHGTVYDIWATETESLHRGGVAVVWRAAKGWRVEITASFGPNVVSFLLMLGSRRFYVVGAYVIPNDMPAVHSVEQVLQVLPKGLEMILMGGLSVRLGNPRDKREEDLLAALVYRGLVNMKYHFLPRRQYRGAGSWKWGIQREGRRATRRGD